MDIDFSIQIYLYKACLIVIDKINPQAHIEHESLILNL